VNAVVFITIEFFRIDAKVNELLNPLSKLH